MEILYQLIVGTFVPQVESLVNPAMYISWSGHLTNTLKKNCLKKNHPLRIQMVIPNSVELYQNNPNISIFYLSRR